MSDAVIQSRLKIGPTIADGIAIGTKSIGPILVNVLLWLITVWIPYLNVGTTIGLAAGIVSKASKGEAIPITEIFEPKYRKYMGEFFITSGLVGMGVTIGLAFGIIPGIVIGLAWSLSLVIAIDKGRNPTEAIALSNKCTYGHKWAITGTWFLTTLIFAVVQLILVGIGAATGKPAVIGVLGILVVLITVFEVFVFVGIQASIYKQLTQGI